MIQRAQTTLNPVHLTRCAKYSAVKICPTPRWEELTLFSGKISPPSNIYRSTHDAPKMAIKKVGQKGKQRKDAAGR